MSRDDHVLIAGAGIGGLTLALMLARAGIASVVLDRAGAPEPVGAGIQLSPNAGRILDGLGLAAAIDAVAARPAAVRVADGRTGRAIADIPLGRDAERRYGAPYRVLHRADLHALLLEAVRACGNVAIIFGAAVTRLHVADSRAGLDADGPDGPHRLDGRLVVGADGMRSRVAAELGLPPAVPACVTAWRATIAGAQIDGAATALWLNCGAHLVAYNLARGRALNLVLVLDDQAAQDTTAVPPTRGGDWAAEPRRLIETAASWTPWPLFTRPAATGWHGPVTLLGDAAHPVLPFLAQGAALAIEDAAVLASALAMPGRSPEEAARRYEHARLSRWRRVQDAAAFTGRLYHLGPMAGRMRDAGLRLLPPGRRLARYDWLYGWRADT